MVSVKFYEVLTPFPISRLTRGVTLGVPGLPRARELIFCTLGSGRALGPLCIRVLETLGRYLIYIYPPLKSGKGAPGSNPGQGAPDYFVTPLIKTGDFFNG